MNKKLRLYISMPFVLLGTIFLFLGFKIEGDEEGLKGLANLLRG